MSACGGLHPDAADDLTQAAFICAYQALQRYEPTRIRAQHLRGWIWTIARDFRRNRAFGHLHGHLSPVASRFRQWLRAGWAGTRRAAHPTRGNVHWMRVWDELNPEDVFDLPIDDLALRILRDLIGSREWNSRNWLLGARRANDHNVASVRAFSEGIDWLRMHGLIARDPEQSAPDAIFITRLGYDVAEQGLDGARASARGLPTHVRERPIRTR